METSEGDRQYFTVTNTSIGAGDDIDSVKMVLHHQYTGSDTFGVRGQVVGSFGIFEPTPSLGSYSVDTSAIYSPTSDPWTVTTINAIEIRVTSINFNLGATDIRVDRAFLLVFYEPASTGVVQPIVVTE